MEVPGKGGEKVWLQKKGKAEGWWSSETASISAWTGEEVMDREKKERRKETFINCPLLDIMLYILGGSRIYQLQASTGTRQA